MGSGSMKAFVGAAPGYELSEMLSQVLPETRQRLIGALNDVDANVKCLEALPTRDLKDVSASEFAMRDWFSELDVDRDHFLSEEEFKVACRTLRPQSTQEEESALFHCINLGRNGKISSSEFHDFMLSAHSKDPGRRVQKLLEAGSIKMLSANWLLSQQQPFVLKRRQDLPEEAFLKNDKATSLWMDDQCSCVALSYGWLSKEHPDPTGFYLQKLLPYLQAHREYFGHRFTDVGVFWDWASLPQNPRTDEERIDFKRGLDIMHLIYSSTDHMVVQLKEMPTFETSVNLTEYGRRGWCTFEAAVAGILKSSHMLFDLSHASACLSNGESWLEIKRCAVISRQPPLHPDDMEKLLVQKIFTNNADKSVVADMYRDYFNTICSSADRLHFQNVGHGEGWGAEEAAQLAKALPMFHSCRFLDLSGHLLEDKGMSCIAVALLRMPALTAVSLQNCGFGEAGLSALRLRMSELVHETALQKIFLPARLEESEEGQEIAKWSVIEFRVA